MTVCQWSFNGLPAGFPSFEGPDSGYNGTSQYLGRGGGGKRKKKRGQGYIRLPRGGWLVKTFLKRSFRGISTLIARYILRGVHWPRWVKQLNIYKYNICETEMYKLYNFFANPTLFYTT